MLYKVRHGVDVFLDNPGLLAIEQYAKLSDQQMKFVILVTDPSKDNPIRTLPNKARRERAAEIAGYKREPDGKRLDKNGRMIAAGQIPSVEKAIEEFKRNHYDSVQNSIAASEQQLNDLREYLKTDKSEYILDDNGKITLDENQKPIRKHDPKILKEAANLQKMIPDLEEALKKLYSLSSKDEPTFSGPTGTIADLGDSVEEIVEGEGSTLDMYNETQKKNENRE